MQRGFLECLYIFIENQLPNNRLRQLCFLLQNRMVMVYSYMVSVGSWSGPGRLILSWSGLVMYGQIFKIDSYYPLSIRSRFHKEPLHYHYCSGFGTIPMRFPQILSKQDRTCHGRVNIPLMPLHFSYVFLSLLTTKMWLCIRYL